MTGAAFLGRRAGAAALCLLAAGAQAPLPAREPVFLDTPNMPMQEPLPVIPTAAPGDGLRLLPGSRNAFSLVFGSGQPGANMLTAQSIRDRFFLNYMVGDLRRAIGSPMDTGQSGNGTFAAVARHTAPGAPGDLHVMAADGMHLRAVCSAGGADCRPGHVWAAMVRLPFVWRPGMVLKVRYKAPRGVHAWAPIWMFTGQQASPGPGGDPYQGFGTPDASYRTSSTLFEIDWNDDYARPAAGVAAGSAIEFGTPDIYGTQWHTKPHPVYRATTGGWRAFGPEFNPEFLAAPFDGSAGFHDLVGNWRNDGSNLVDLFVDGRLVATNYMEYPQSTYLDPRDHQTKTVGMHLIIGNQAIPSFAPGASRAVNNDGTQDGWTITIQEVSGWVGGLATSGDTPKE